LEVTADVPGAQPLGGLLDPVLAQDVVPTL